MLLTLALLACTTSVPVVAEGDELVVHGDRLEIAYAPSRRGEIAGRALGWDDGLGELGVTRVLIYVSDDDFARGRALEAAGTCPAGYWNSHMKVAALVTADPEMRAELTGADIEEGDRVTLTGEWLGVTRSEVDGRDFPIRGQHSYFAPKRMLIAEATR